MYRHFARTIRDNCRYICVHEPQIELNSIMVVGVPAPEATRQRVLAAAMRELIARDGQLEVHPVARRAKGSVGVIYHHFGSKQGLLAAVVDDFYDRFDAVVIEPNPAPGATWGEREHERTRLAVEFHYDEPLAAVILGRLAREPEVAAIEAERLARHIDAAARNIEIAQGRAEIPADLDAGLAGAMVLGGLRQAIGAALNRPQPPPRAELTEHIWRFIAAAVRYTPPNEETTDGR
jgi:AcrR family transcriptional regulator